MFAYDINTADIFNTKSIVNWEQSNLPTTLGYAQPYAQPFANKKMPVTQPAPVSPVKLPPSAFTQVSSSTDSWNVSADAWKTTPQAPTMMASSDHPPSKKELHAHPEPAPLDAPTKQNLYKTELCRNWMETRQCRYGPKCQFAHGEDELRGLLRHPKYKTEICRSFHTSGKCSYGNRCRFVHSAAEMRTPEGALLDDNGYAFQQQLAQLKFVDIMPSPNQSLFTSGSSNSFIPKEWLAEVDRLQLGDRRLEQTHVQMPVGSPALSHQAESFTPQTLVPPSAHMVPLPVPQSQLNASTGLPITIDELAPSAAKSFTFLSEEDSDSADEFSNEEIRALKHNNLKKSGSSRRLGFFQKLYTSKTDKKSKS